MLIAIEGVDGAGKRTLTRGSARGVRGRRQDRREPVLSPLRPLGHGRPGRRSAARRARRPLDVGLRDGGAVRAGPGRVPARRSATCTREYDVVILDRYVASNAAYSAARLHQGTDGDVVDWVRELEYGRLSCPRPIVRCCSMCPPSWPPSGPSIAPTPKPTGRRMPTNATTICSSAPARFTPGWPPRDWCGRWLVVAPGRRRRRPGQALPHR